MPYMFTNIIEITSLYLEYSAIAHACQGWGRGFESLRPLQVFHHKSMIYEDLQVANFAGTGSVSHRYTTERQRLFFGESFPLSPSYCASRPTPSSGGTPQRPKIQSGAGDALCPAGPSALLLRARRFTAMGPARTLNRQTWFHAQASKADKSRLSACTSNDSDFRLLSGCDFSSDGNRWPLAQFLACEGES